MKIVNNKLLLAAAIAALLAGCDSGGIDIEPTTIDNSTNNPTPAPTPDGETYDGPCASYEVDGDIVHGDFNDVSGNCVYQRSFVDAGNPLMTDVTIPTLAAEGAHVFIGSLIVGQNYTTIAEANAAGIMQGGDGPVLTVEPGVTIAFNSAAQAFVVNRGSQIHAEGNVSAPITITSRTDVEGELTGADVAQWGGMVINGFGVTNKCSYTGTYGDDLALVDGECNVDMEGLVGDAVSTYGGNNDADSSGVLRYVRVKHTGFDVEVGNELNGIAFGAVGSGTVVENLQTYATQDDGIEMFGGAVSFKNYVGMFSDDDTIDIDQGYRGTIENALVIQAENSGNHCIEADGIGSHDDLTETRRDEIYAANLNSQPTINGLTCIVSANIDGPDGDGAGWHLREGIYPTITNSMIVVSFIADANGADPEISNYCVSLEDGTQDGALNGDYALKSNIFACEDKGKGSVGSDSVADFLAANGNVVANITGAVDPTSNADTNLQILEGALPVYSIATETMVVNDTAVSISPSGDRAYLGALSQSDTDWTSGWTFGLDSSLWIAN